MMKLPILPCADKLETSLVYRTKTWTNTVCCECFSWQVYNFEPHRFL